MQKAYTNSDASEDDVSSKGNNQTENQSASDTVAENVLPSESGSILEGKTEEMDSISKIVGDTQKEDTIENYPVHVLQLSQAVLVPESLDDEGSLIIPPTPIESGSIPFIVPSTPTDEKCEDQEKPSEKDGEDETSGVDKEADAEKRKDVDLTPPNLVPTTKLLESPDDQSQNTFSLTEPDFRNGESEDFTETSFTEKDDKKHDESNHDSKGEGEDWGLHLSASEATQSLQFVLDDEAEDEKKDEVEEDGISREEDKNISAGSDDIISPVKEKSLSEPEYVEPEIEDGEAKKPESELLNLNSSPTREEPVFHIETPAINVSAATEKSAALDETCSTVQPDNEDSKASKTDQSDRIQDSSDNEKDLPEEQACEDEEANSEEVRSPKTSHRESPVPEKDVGAEEESPDTEKKKSPAHESEDVESKKSEKEATDEPDMTPPPPPSNSGNTPQVQSAEDLKLVEKEAEVDDRKAVLSQSTEKTQSFVGSSQESPPSRRIFSFTDVNSFVEQCDAHFGRKPSDPESVLNSKPGEVVNFMYAVISKKDAEVYQTVYFLDELSKIPYFSGNISPQTSTSTSTSKKSLHHSSLMSGELGDISSSLSSKSPPSSAGFQQDSKYIQTLASFESSQDANMLTITELNEGSFITSTRKTPIKSKNIRDNKTLGGKKISDTTGSSTEEARFVRPANSSASKRSVGRKRRYAKDNPPDGSLLPASTTLPKESVPLKRKIISSSSSSSSKTPIGSHKKNAKQNAKKKRKVNIPEENVSDEACMEAEPADAEVLSIEEDPNLSSSDRILPGVRVMARWKDGYYYPGEVISQVSDTSWKTKFDDGATHTIPEENMVKIAQLPKQCSVLVRSADDYFDPGIITGHFRDGQECGYIVEQDNGLTKRYPRACVILTADQASLILGINASIVSPSSSAVSLDNIVSGKRRRTPVLATSASPALRTRLKRKAKNPDPNLQSTAESEGVSDAVTPKGSGKTSKRRALITAESPDKSPKLQETEPSCDVIEEERKEETTEKDSSTTGTGKKLFEGFAFLLSQTDQLPDESAALTPNSDLENSEEGLSGQFDKKHVSSLIEAEGGVVYDSFEECQKAASATNVYLLASTYLRTIKYMQCLATGIPCVRHTWITHSCCAGEVLDYRSYVLPAGFSVLEDKVVEWHGKTDALKGLKISLIAERNKAFLDTWTPVLLAAKADLVQKSSLLSYAVKDTSVIDIVVTDSSCPKKFLTAAERNRLPVVSSEWVIQCLICGFRLPHDAHPKFRHNYTE